MLNRTRILAITAACCAAALPAQGASPTTTALPAVVTPDGFREGQWVPMAVLWGTADAEADARRQRAVAAAGVACARLEGRPEADALGRSLYALRHHYRIDQGALHALIGDRPTPALTSLLAQRHEFQTVTVFGAARSAGLAGVRRLRARRVAVLGDVDAAALAAHVRKLHDARAAEGAAGAVGRALDSFHDAAAVGDEDRYFAIFPGDAVFLGTDATERWSGEEFRAFAMPYFQRESAWTYVPFERRVTIAPGGELAWFDEALDNAGYGECRGTGVLVRRGDAWVLQQYNLTVPVPNDLMAGFAKRIRAHLDGAGR